MNVTTDNNWSSSQSEHSFKSTVKNGQYNTEKSWAVLLNKNIFQSRKYNNIFCMKAAKKALKLVLLIYEKKMKHEHFHPVKKNLAL